MGPKPRVTERDFFRQPLLEQCEWRSESGTKRRRVFFDPATGRYAGTWERRRPLVNGGRNPPLNGGVRFPGTIFEQRLSKMSRSGVKGKRSLAQRILDAAKGQKTGIGCDRGRTHKSAFSPPFNGGFAPPLTPLPWRRIFAAV
jgi:hypothetical protein